MTELYSSSIVSHFLLELSLLFIITNALNIDFLYNRGARAEKYARALILNGNKHSLKRKKTEDGDIRKGRLEYRCQKIVVTQCYMILRLKT